MFKSKASKISFNSDKQLFEIEDHWKSQLLLFRIIGASMLFFSVVNWINTDFSNELFIVTTILHLPLLFIFLFFISSQSLIRAKEIKNVIVRRGTTSATIGLNLKNHKRRTLFVFETKDIEEMVNLFRENGVFIKEKSFLFS